jgi:NDP-sugar pyrophosphorylase family protein
MRLTAYIARWPHLPFGPDDTAPWLITANAPALIRAAITTLGREYRRDGETAIHASALLRGGVFLDEGCIIGPAVELKTAFMFSGAKTAHLNVFGDSLIGADANLEAGSIVANYRNELDDKMIRIRLGDRVIETGVD